MESTENKRPAATPARTLGERLAALLSSLRADARALERLGELARPLLADDRLPAACNARAAGSCARDLLQRLEELEKQLRPDALEVARWLGELAAHEHRQWVEAERPALPADPPWWRVVVEAAGTASEAPTATPPGGAPAPAPPGGHAPEKAR